MAMQKQTKTLKTETQWLDGL